MSQRLTIGTLALASPLAPDVFARAKAFLETQGVELLTPLDPCEHYGRYDHLFSAASKADRLSAFLELANNPKVSLILLARGGYGSMELLDSFRVGMVKRKSPLYVSGFSDNTAFLFSLLGHRWVHPVHGPTLSSFAAELELALCHWQELMSLCNSLQAVSPFPFGEAPLTLLCGNAGGLVKGPLLGGNLTLCNALFGTSWSPKLGRAIFFFEDTGVKPYALHRMLLQMKLSSKFRSLAAVIVGDISEVRHGVEKGPSAEDVLRDIFEPMKIPVYIQAPFGHGARIAPLLLGRKARIEKSILQYY